MEEEPAALGQISEEAAQQEEFDASVAEIAKVAFVLPASGAVPTLHWVFATPWKDVAARRQTRLARRARSMACGRTRKTAARRPSTRPGRWRRT